MKNLLFNLITMLGGVISCKIALWNALLFKQLKRQTYSYPSRFGTLKLDLYLPNKTSNPALLIWIHGGGWICGSRAIIEPEIIAQVKRGYALASISYHFSQKAKWPQQAHDINAAIEFLQQNAKKLGYDGDKIALCGISAGGHLASFIGNNNPSDAIKAIISISGPSNMEKLAQQNWAAQKLTIFLTGTDKKIMKQASPVHYVSPTSPPHFMLHGTSDFIVHHQQSDALYKSLTEEKIECTYLKGEGFGHADYRFSRQEYAQALQFFLDKHLT